MNNEIDSEEFKLRKKKYSKKVESVPFDNLGFKAKTYQDVIDPRNIKRPIRSKYSR